MSGTAAIKPRTKRSIAARNENQVCRVVEAEIGRFGSVNVTAGVGGSVPETPEYFVAAYGSDSNNGTSRATAVATLERAYELAAQNGWNSQATITVVSTASAGDAIGTTQANVEIGLATPPNIFKYRTPNGAPGGAKAPLRIRGETTDLYTETLTSVGITGGEEDETLGTYSLVTFELGAVPPNLQRGDYLEITLRTVVPVEVSIAYMVWAHTPGSPSVVLATSLEASNNLPINATQVGDSVRIYRLHSRLNAASGVFFTSGELLIQDLKLRNSILDAGGAPTRFVAFISCDILILSGVHLELQALGQEFFFNELSTIFFGGNFLADLQVDGTEPAASPVFVIANIDDASYDVDNGGGETEASLTFNRCNVNSDDMCFEGPVGLKFRESSLENASTMVCGTRGNAVNADGLQTLSFRGGKSRSEIRYFYTEGGRIGTSSGSARLITAGGTDLEVRSGIMFENLHSAPPGVPLTVVQTEGSRAGIRVRGAYNLSAAVPTLETCDVLLGIQNAYCEGSLEGLPNTNRLDGASATAQYGGGPANYGDGYLTDINQFQIISL